MRPRRARSAAPPRGRRPTWPSRPGPGRHPSTACPMMGSGGGDLHDQGVALAPAAAEGGDAGQAAASAELEGEVQHDTGAEHADRVTERDRAAIDVDLLVGDAE